MFINILKQYIQIMWCWCSTSA